MRNISRLCLFDIPLVSVLAAATMAGCATDSPPDPSTADVATTSQALSGCKNGFDPTSRCRNQDEFVTARGGSYFRGPMLGAMNEKAADTATRKVQESDVYRLAGKSLFVLNQARGFQVIDVAKQDHPRMIGRLDIAGQPREMYVDTEKKRAYVLVDGTLRYSDKAISQTSSVAVLDYASRTEPQLIGSLEIEGNIVESRRVGDVVYVVSNVWTPAADGLEGAEQTVVKSIYVGSAKPHVVGKLSFDGGSYQIHASDKFLFASKFDGQQTAIDVFDISSPTGQIARGRTVSVPGYLQDRFSMNMDAASGVLRVVSHAWDGNGTIHVTTFGVPTALGATALGSLVLPNIGTLLATRFDGDKAYLVHMIRIDPLDVIDLSNPAQPTRLSSLEIPGWLEDLEIRGDRVVGIGMDNSAGQNRVAVAIYDVSDPKATREMSRTLLGEGGQYHWTNFWESRTFKMLDDRGLLLVPFSAWSEGSSFQTVQLVDVDLVGGVVKARGRVDQAGEATRSFGLKDRVGSLTYRQFSVANVDDRDHPFVAASVELSRPIVDFTKTHSAGIQLVNDWSRAAELRAVPLSNADAELPGVYSVLTFKGAERVFPSGQDVVVLWHEWFDGQQVTRLTSVDYSDPRHPVRRGEIKLETNGALYGYGARGEANQSDVMQMEANLFVLAQDNGKERNFELVSFADPWRPEVVSTAGVPSQGEIVEVRVLGAAVYLTTFEPDPRPVVEEPVVEESIVEEAIVEEAIVPVGAIDPAAEPVIERVEGSSFEKMSMWGRPYRAFIETGKHFLTRIAFDGARLAPSKPVNVPGVLVDVAADGRLITLDQRVPAESDGQVDRALDTLRVSFSRGTATLRDVLDVDDGVATAMVRGSSVYYTTAEQGPGRCPPWARCFSYWGGASNWTLHTVSVHGHRMTEKGALLLQTNGAGSVLDIQQVGDARYGFVSFSMGGFGLLNLSNASAPEVTAFMPWNGWTSDVLVDPARRQATLSLGDNGVRTIALP